MKTVRSHFIIAIIGIAIGFIWAWITGPHIIEEHQHWCDGVEVTRTYLKK